MYNLTDTYQALTYQHGGLFVDPAKAANEMKYV